MRCIDADALEKEGWSLHRTIRVDKNTEEYQTKPLRQVPAIEPRCETCEAFNKTRLLIPQPERKRGKWIPVTNGRGGFECDQCHNYAPSYQDGVEWLSGFCPNCGADMREPEDIPMEYFESGGR